MPTKLIRDLSLLSEDEKIIIALFRSLSPEGKQEFFRCMRHSSGLNTEQFIDELKRQVERHTMHFFSERVTPLHMLH